MSLTETQKAIIRNLSKQAAATYTAPQVTGPLPTNIFTRTVSPPAGYTPVAPVKPTYPLPIGKADTLQQEIQAYETEPLGEALGGELIKEEKLEGLDAVIKTGATYYAPEETIIPQGRLPAEGPLPGSPFLVDIPGVEPIVIPAHVQPLPPEDFLTAIAVTAGLAGGVVAPSVAIVGALAGTGLSQAAKAVTGGGWLTPQEALTSAGVGAAFNVVGGSVTGGLGHVAPVLVEKSLLGSVSRIGLTGLLGAGGGGLFGAGQAALYKGDVFEGAKSGALVGGALGLGLGATSELIGFAVPRIKEGLNKLNPERELYNRVMGSGSDKTTSFIDRVIGKLSPERNLYNRVFREVTGRTGKIDSGYSGSGFKFSDSEVSSGTPRAAGGSFAQQILYKQAPIVKAPMKPMLSTLTIPKTMLIPSLVPPKTVSKRKTYGLITTPKQITKQAQQQRTRQQTELSPLSGLIQNPFAAFQGKSYYRQRRREELDELAVLSYPQGGLATPKEIGGSLSLPKTAERQR